MYWFWAEIYNPLTFGCCLKLSITVIFLYSCCRQFLSDPQRRNEKFSTISWKINITRMIYCERKKEKKLLSWLFFKKWTRISFNFHQLWRHKFCFFRVQLRSFFSWEDLWDLGKNIKEEIKFRKFNYEWCSKIFLADAMSFKVFPNYVKFSSLDQFREIKLQWGLVNNFGLNNVNFIPLKL